MLLLDYKMIWKPFIENYINDENSTWAGWEVHRVVSPTGNGFSWSVVTVDHFTTLSGALNSFPRRCKLARRITRNQ